LGADAQASPDRQNGTTSMSKMAKVTKAIKASEAAPRFLLFLKTPLRRRSAEEPAKSNPLIETIVILLFCFVILAILVITFKKLRHG
jgi:hypothetical protein